MTRLSACVVSLLFGLVAAAGAETTAVGVLSRHGAPAADRRATRVINQLRADGVDAQRLDANQLIDGNALRPDAFAVLVMPDSPRFPAAAFPVLQRYLRAGGDVVFLGGVPFSHPVVRDGDRWVSVEDALGVLARQPQRRHLLFDFDRANLTEWRRGASNREAKSAFTLEPGRSGQGLHLCLRDVSWYDVLGAAISTALPADHNAVCLWARGDPGTPQLFIEFTERDGARWSRAVDISADWRFYALPAVTFQFKRDGSPANRGGKGDGLQLSRAARLTVGLAKDRTPHIAPGQRDLWVDEIATCRVSNGLANVERMSLPELPEAYAVYRCATAVSCRTAGPSPDSLPPVELGVGLRCRSAVLHSVAGLSEFRPLLALHDKHDRIVGWAAGLLVHFAGPYKGSQWALWTAEDDAFYRQPQALAHLSAVVRGMLTGRWIDQTAAEHDRAATRRLELRTPPPAPLQIRDGHFALPDGRRFFIIGVDFWNSFDTYYGGGGQWDVDRLERDFQRMDRAGINAIRVHGFSRFARDNEPHRLQAFLELCRRHRIYFLAEMGLGKFKQLTGGRPAIENEARRVASLLKDEPTLLGYDLQNEPYSWEIGKAPGEDGVPLARRHPSPVNGWRDYLRWLHVADGDWTSTFPLLRGPLRRPNDERLRQAFDSADSIFSEWLSWCVSAIRQVDNSHPITVGYNTIFDCLPANKILDFVSHHCYEPPADREHVLRNLTTLDRLRAVWSDRPITLGEFGYSSGDVIRGSTLDIDTQSVGEILHYLYALSHDFDGVMKWQLCDGNPAYQWQRATWRRNDPVEKRVREQRFGMFWEDGSQRGRSKPIALATRFLRDCLDAGLRGGQLTIRDDENLIGVGYVFHGAGVLFVGGRQHTSPELSFTSHTPANVMLRWSADNLTVMATADVEIRLDPTRFVSALRADNVTIDGRLADRTITGARLRLGLLAGDTVRLRRKQ